MKQIFQIVNQNREEAIDLVKKNGGRIDFVEDIIRNNPDNPDEDDWDGYIAEEDVPWVLMALDCIVDTAVLAVRLDNNRLMFLCYDVEKQEVYGWYSRTTCCAHTDNEVYLFIDKFLKNK